MHFTALEMGDNNPGEPDAATGLRPYSLAKTLVGWIGDYAYRVGTDLKGENALSGGVQYDFGWDQINDAFDDLGLPRADRATDGRRRRGHRRHPLRPVHRDVPLTRVRRAGLR